MAPIKKWLLKELAEMKDRVDQFRLGDRKPRKVILADVTKLLNAKCRAQWKESLSNEHEKVSIVRLLRRPPADFISVGKDN